MDTYIRCACANPCVRGRQDYKYLVSYNTSLLLFHNAAEGKQSQKLRGDEREGSGEGKGVLRRQGVCGVCGREDAGLVAHSRTVFYH